MASKKFLDQGGVSHLWDKVKEYLNNRFGTGTYDNDGTHRACYDAYIAVWTSKKKCYLMKSSFPRLNQIKTHLNQGAKRIMLFSELLL